MVLDPSFRLIDADPGFPRSTDEVVQIVSSHSTVLSEIDPTGLSPMASKEIGRQDILFRLGSSSTAGVGTIRSACLQLLRFLPLLALHGQLSKGIPGGISPCSGNASRTVGRPTSSFVETAILILRTYQVSEVLERVSSVLGPGARHSLGPDSVADNVDGGFKIQDVTSKRCRRMGCRKFL